MNKFLLFEYVSRDYNDLKLHFHLNQMIQKIMKDHYITYLCV